MGGHMADGLQCKVRHPVHHQQKERNKVKAMTRQAQKQFENSLAKNSKENPKAI